MKVILTRRKEDSERSAERFSEIGFETHTLPLFERQATGDGMPNGDFDFSIFTSSAAIDALATDAHQYLRERPAYAVGPKTAQALKDRAYSTIRTGEGEAAQLVEMIKNDFPASTGARAAQPHTSRGLYPCGRARSFDFPAAFASVNSPSGTEICEWEIYEINALDPGKKAFDDALRGNKPLLIPLYSPLSSAHFFDLIAEHALRDCFTRAHLLLISQRCLEEVPDRYSDQITVAERPDEEGILLAAQSIRSQFSKP